MEGPHAEVDTLDQASLERWMAAPMRDLVQHLMARYHREARLGMAELENLAGLAALLEGRRVPVLVTLRDEVDLFCKEMREHLQIEETTLLPAVLAHEAGEDVAVDLELVDPLDLLDDEHEATFRLLTRISALAQGFEEGALPVQAELARIIRDLAASLRDHVRLEAEVLFKRLPRPL
jgi:regulator of cell morphogenesis and NO signaling